MKNSILKNIKISGFKCFKKAHIPLKRLSVLTGLNGAGKSTVLQSLLLFSQTLREMEIINNRLFWPLNGELVSLGTFGEVHNSESPDSKIHFEYNFDDETKPLKFKLSAKPSDSNLSSPLKAQEFLKNYSQIKQMQYLGPLRTINGDILSIPNKQNFYREGLGTDGRFAGFWFYKNSESNVHKGQLFDEEVSNFRVQVNNWLNFIATGSQVSVIPTADTRALALKFHQFDAGKLHRTTNFGFGISYVFPIIVSLLCAQRGDIILIDSPEAHLHPRAQSRVGRMIAKFAAFGVQVILETHSDHVLNGIRIAVMKEILKPSDVSVVFFSDETLDNEQVIPAPINKNGQFENWPEGFFDQIDKDLIHLIEGK